MKTEKFTQSAEAFNNNLSNSMKWFQDSFATMMEVQNTQFKFAYDAFYSTMNLSMSFFARPNFAIANETTEKMTGLFQKNMETLTKMAQENMKTAIELSTHASSLFNSKESMDQMIDMYTKQVSAIVSFNQTAFDNLTHQFEISKGFTNEFNENLKKGFESNLQMMNDTMKEFMGTYTNNANPFFESNKNIFGTLTTQMENAYATNMKIWTDLFSKYQHTATANRTDTGFNPAKKAEHKEPAPKHSKLQPLHA